MPWLDEQKDEVLKAWLRHTKAPMLSTLPDGKILWCNPAYEEMLGYTRYELVGKMSWTELTTDEDELEADKQGVSEVVNGIRKDYQLQKAYRKKSGVPCPVIIHVLRYPLQGDFQFFLVSVAPLDEGYHHALEVVNATRQELIELTKHVTDRSFGWDQAIKWSKENPGKAGIVASVGFGFLFGERFLSVLERVIEILRGTGANGG